MKYEAHVLEQVKYNKNHVFFVLFFLWVQRYCSTFVTVKVNSEWLGAVLLDKCKFIINIYMFLCFIFSRNIPFIRYSNILLMSCFNNGKGANLHMYVISFREWWFEIRNQQSEIRKFRSHSDSVMEGKLMGVL